MSATWDTAREQVASAADLPPDWNDAGAGPPASCALVVARRLLDRLEQSNIQPPSRVLPTADGGLVAEWYLGRGYYEAEVCSDGCIEWMWKTPAGYSHRVTDEAGAVQTALELMAHG